MRTVRVLAYAINGRGMGHLTRQLAILRWIRWLGAAAGVKVEAWVLTSSEADTLARREGVPSIKIPSKAMMRDAGLEPARYLAVARGWVLQAVATLQPDLLIVDTFPTGSFGELAMALELAKKRVLVLRATRPEAAKEAQPEAALAAYDKVIVPDEDTAPILLRERPELRPREAARAALGVPEASRACWVALGGGGDPTAARTLPRLVDRVRKAGWHVIVAAGPLYVGEERRGPGITWLDRYASMELLNAADVAVSAGGYNSVHELRFAGIPTVFLPQEKLADDQTRRALSWGPVAKTVDEAVSMLEGLEARSPQGRNGARDAAATALALVVDAAEVERAKDLLDDDAFAAFVRAGLKPEKGLGLLRRFGGDSPTDLARRRVVLGELRDRGIEVAEPRASKGASVARFLDLCRESRVDSAVAGSIADTLAARFPAATPADLLAACEALFPQWATWGDWLGTLSLLRALPTQRDYAIRAFAADIGRWSARAEDPYVALRHYHQLEGEGRTVAEILRLEGP